MAELKLVKTDKPDWADEIASKIAIDDYQYDCAIQLRKAKADGLREAAGMCGKMARKWTENNFRGTAVGCLELQNLLNVEADKIENP